MAIPKGLKKKIENAIRAHEKKQLNNNYFLIKAPDKPRDIPIKSLVVILTDYEDNAA